MTMEPIQNRTAVYQGSGAAVEKTQSAPKAETKVAERTAPVAEQTNAGNETGRPEDQISMPEKASDSSLKNAVEQINRKSAGMEAIFGYHEGTHRVTIKIVDKDTKEVKKEYPAEKTLDMIQKVWEMAGLMVDEKR
ncbi:MAG: flagellar protein FlaG [Eubacterium sp.]|nr:flagellar protein FlaG [Eubacterium sp.]